MLDTDICSYIMKRSSEPLLERLRAVPPADVCMSVITASELVFGVELSPHRERDSEALHALRRHVLVLDLPEEAAVHYGRIRADLKRRGDRIGANDLFIAAHCRCLGLTLVTNNTAELGRVDEIPIENWTVPDFDEDEEPSSENE